MNTWASTISAAVIAGVIFFFLGRTTAPVVPPTYLHDTTLVPVVLVDTLTRIEYKTLPARIETVWVEDDTPLVTASTQKVVQTGEYRDTVAVSYHFPPVNTFDVSLGLQPRRHEVQTIHVTERIPCPPKTVWDRIAVGPGASMTYASGKLHFGPAISVTFDVLP